MHNLPVIGAFIMQKALRPHFGQTRLILCTAAARLGLSHMRVALPAAGGFLAPFFMYVGISLLYASVAGALVSFVEPLAAGSGIAEVKTYLNGIHIRGLLAVSILSMPWSCHSHSNICNPCCVPYTHLGRTGSIYGICDGLSVASLTCNSHLYF